MFIELRQIGADVNGLLNLNITTGIAGNENGTVFNAMDQDGRPIELCKTAEPYESIVARLSAAGLLHEAARVGWKPKEKEEMPNPKTWDEAIEAMKNGWEMLEDHDKYYGWRFKNGQWERQHGGWRPAPFPNQPPLTNEGDIFLNREWRKPQ